MKKNVGTFQKTIPSQKLKIKDNNCNSEKDEIEEKLSKQITENFQTLYEENFKEILNTFMQNIMIKNLKRRKK